MRVRFAAPDRRLAPYVQLYWGWDASAGTPLPRALPAVQTEIIIHRVGRPLVSGSGPRAVRMPDMHVVGPRLSYVDLGCDEALSFVAIRFEPGGLSRLGNLPASELRDLLPALADSIPELYRLLEPALYELDFHLCVEIVDAALLEALRGSRHGAACLPPGDEIPAQFFSVKELADDLGYSERQLRRIFSEQLGLRPVEYLRLLRFQRTLTRIAREPGLDLARLALEAGYSDQSHLNLELKFFSGRTPAFFRENTDLHRFFLPDYGPL